jgi:malonyl-CoA/methylmalonyl-CoA synthetase
LLAAGVASGDRVAAQVEKSPEALALYLATVRAGAVFLPLNTAYTLAELAYFLGDAEPKVVVCRARLADAIGGIAGAATVLTLGEAGDGTLIERATGQPGTFPDVPRGPGDLAAILYTSGTTGRSKGAMLTTANLYSNAVTLRDLWQFTAADVLLHALPIFHVHGLFTACNTLLAAGGSMLWLSRFDAAEVLRLLPRVTTMMGVPTFYVRLLAEPGLTREPVRHVRLLVAGSAPLLAETHRAFEERTGHRILERYGMTETGMLTSNPYEGERRAGTVGLPLPGVDLRIADPETGRALPQGEVGVIEVRGPNVFKGYWRMPEKTAAEFRADGFFITGDVGMIDARGYVSIVGRAKDLIITGGYNVYPKEIEGELDALPGVVESAVIGVPHPDFGEGVTAVVVAERGTLLDERAVLDALAARLARFKLPKRVIVVAELPRNAMGKVQKNVLRERYAGLYGG